MSEISPLVISAMVAMLEHRGWCWAPVPDGQAIPNCVCGGLFPSWEHNLDFSSLLVCTGLRLPVPIRQNLRGTPHPESVCAC